MYLSLLKNINKVKKDLDYWCLSLCFLYCVYLGGGRGRGCGGQGQLAERQLAFEAAALCLALSELL